MKLILRITIGFLVMSLMNFIAFANNLPVEPPAETKQHIPHHEEYVMNDAAQFFEVTSEAVGVLVKKIFSVFGTPSAVIQGEEAGAALVIGAKYGSGFLKILRPNKRDLDRNNDISKIYWKSISVGVDGGVDLSKVYMLVYRVHNPEKLYRNFVAIEGSVFVGVGGSMNLGANVYKSGGLVVIPIRTGAGLRIGANINSFKFTPSRDWLPF